MTPEQRLRMALVALRKAQTDFCDALDAFLIDGMHPRDVQASDRELASTATTPRRQGTAAPPPKPLPTPSTPARKPKDLDDATREESVKDALPVARQILKHMGSNAAMLRDGLKGQLALQRIPFDDYVLDRVLADAKREAAQ